MPRTGAGSRTQKTARDWHFAQWLDKEAKERGISRRAIARHFGYESPSRITEYLTGKRRPRPDAVRKFAGALRISPIEALRRAGYYAAIFEEFAKLYERGWLWCQRDMVSLTAYGVSFTGSHIALEGDDPTTVPPHRRSDYHQAYVYGTYLGERQVQYQCGAPLPISIGILLAVGLFPRRGDVLKNEADRFIHELAAVSEPILREEWVNKNANRPPSSWHALELATELFEDRGRPGATRASISAEYVHEWADQVCKMYARFARLALYNSGGRVQYSESGTVGYFEEDPWEYQYADLPTIAEFTIARSY